MSRVEFCRVDLDVSTDDDLREVLVHWLGFSTGIVECMTREELVDQIVQHTTSHIECDDTST